MMTQINYRKIQFSLLCRHTHKIFNSPPTLHNSHLTGIVHAVKLSSNERVSNSRPFKSHEKKVKLEVASGGAAARWRRVVVSVEYQITCFTKCLPTRSQMLAQISFCCFTSFHLHTHTPIWYTTWDLVGEFSAYVRLVMRCFSCIHT